MMVGLFWLVVGDGGFIVVSGGGWRVYFGWW